MAAVNSVSKSELVNAANALAERLGELAGLSVAQGYEEEADRQRVAVDAVAELLGDVGFHLEASRLRAKYFQAQVAAKKKGLAEL